MTNANHKVRERKKNFKKCVRYRMDSVFSERSFRGRPLGVSEKNKSKNTRPPPESGDGGWESWSSVNRVNHA